MMLRSISLFLVSFLASWPASLDAPIPGDATRGAELVKSQKCVSCHSVAGEGGKTAPDLAKKSRQAYTPSLMASLMWNHAPQMWPAMERAGIERPRLSEEQAADLFAYFFAQRYFEAPGDAGRGKQAFEAKKCSACHRLDEPGPEGAPPVKNWRSNSDAIELARTLWNHAPKMRDALAKQGAAWPRLTAQELTDMLVFARNTPGAERQPARFAPASAETGDALFTAKGCKSCHAGPDDLRARLRTRTTTDLAVALWNHAGKMVQLPPELSEPEMRRLVGYLWSKQYFERPGDARKGEKVFTAKKCASCHQQGGAAPALGGGKPVNAITIVSGLWRHGPDMLGKMKSQNVAWPRFRETEMADLIAYVNSRH